MRSQHVLRGYSYKGFNVVKVFYLLLGILLKQTVDEFKVLNQFKITELENERENISQYRGNPAIRVGSLEDAQMMGAYTHMTAIQPDLERIDRDLRYRRYLPLGLYSVFTLVLLGIICWLESIHPTL